MGGSLSPGSIFTTFGFGKSPTTELVLSKLTCKYTMSIKGGGCINKLDNDYLGQVTNFSDDDVPVQNLVQIKTENEQRLKSNISLLHTYLEKYDFKQILTYLFTREIELTSNIENVFTDEPLITNYIADIYLSTRAKSLNEIGRASCRERV